MKLPKITKRYCPKCKKATEQKIEFYKSGGKRSSLTHGSIERAMKRGQGRGVGNKGKQGRHGCLYPFCGRFKICVTRADAHAKHAEHVCPVQHL